MTKKLILFAALAFLFGSSDRCVIAEENGIPKTKIAVTTSAKESVKGEFESYIKREFRSLKDVEIVDSEADFTISFVILETQTKGGGTTGYAISQVLSHPFPRSVFHLMFKDKLSPKDFEWIKKATEAAKFVDGHSLRTCGPDELKSVCEKLVAEFDTNTLEPARKLIQQFKGTISNQSK